MPSCSSVSSISATVGIQPFFAHGVPRFICALLKYADQHVYGVRREKQAHFRFAILFGFVHKMNAVIHGVVVISFRPNNEKRTIRKLEARLWREVVKCCHCDQLLLFRFPVNGHLTFRAFDAERLTPVRFKRMLDQYRLVQPHLCSYSRIIILN